MACATKPPAGSPKTGSGIYQSGTASWYGQELAGRPTASGEPFRPSGLTAAHRTLPFGTLVEVIRIDTGARVQVVINDRGPFSGGRVIDLSEGAAEKLGLIDDGTTTVELRVLGCPGC